MLRAVEQKIKVVNTIYKPAVSPNNLQFCQKYPGQRWKIPHGYAQYIYLKTGRWGKTTRNYRFLSKKDPF